MKIGVRMRGGGLPGRLLVVLLALACASAQARSEAAGENSEAAPEGLRGLSIGGEFFINGVVEDQGDGEQAEFFIRRAYLTARQQILPFLSARLTLDTNQDGEGDGEGDMEVRLKYTYARFDVGSLGPLTRLRLLAGMVHAPWLSYESNVNHYRMREKFFAERSGIFNSADFGVRVAGLLGPALDREWASRARERHPGRWGSFAVGLYNGGGYHAIERNVDKNLEGRLTLRPLPGLLPGLQLSSFGVFGKGNVAGDRADLPDWNMALGALTLQGRRGTLAVTGVAGEGNQDGSWVEDSDSTDALPFYGGSLFGELRLGTHWRVIAGADRFEVEGLGQGAGATAEPRRYTRGFVGVGYDFGGGNILLADMDWTDHDDPAQPDERWLQLTLRVAY